MVNYLNFDGSSVGTLPAGFANVATLTGKVGQFQVGTSGAISSPNAIHDSSGQSGGSAIWLGILAADQAIQFDQVVSRSGGPMNPLVRVAVDGSSGYGAQINWAGPSVQLVSFSQGTVSTLNTSAIPSFTDGSQVTIKLEVQGTTLRF